MGVDSLGGKGGPSLITLLGGVDGGLGGSGSGLVLLDPDKADSLLGKAGLSLSGIGGASLILGEDTAWRDSEPLLVGGLGGSFGLIVSSVECFLGEDMPFEEPGELWKDGDKGDFGDCSAPSAFSSGWCSAGSGCGKVECCGLLRVNVLTSWGGRRSNLNFRGYIEREREHQASLYLIINTILHLQLF